MLKWSMHVQIHPSCRTRVNDDLTIEFVKQKVASR